MPRIKYTISVPEAARQIGISKPNMYILARQADFPSFSVGNRILIYEEDFAEWVKTQARNHAHISLSPDKFTRVSLSLSNADVIYAKNVSADD